MKTQWDRLQDLQLLAGTDKDTQTEFKNEYITYKIMNKTYFSYLSKASLIAQCEYALRSLRTRRTMLEAFFQDLKSIVGILII